MPLSAILNAPGRVFVGSREVTSFERATLTPLGGGRWRLVAAEHQPDPYWWAHRDPDAPLSVWTRLGRMAARYVADEPLTLEIWSEDA